MPTRVEALAALAAALARAGDEHQANALFDEAQGTAYAIFDYTSRAKALAALAAALIQAGHYEKAQEIISRLTSDEQLEALSAPIATLAQMNHFSQALTLIGLRQLDEFLLTLMAWVPFFEQIQMGLSVEVLREAINIAGWERPAWREIYALLSKVRQDSYSATKEAMQ